jgi:hypothetical protein
MKIKIKPIKRDQNQATSLPEVEGGTEAIWKRK